MSERDLTVGDYMSQTPHSIGVDQSLLDAGRRMHQLAVRHLPVLDGGKLVGILSERDIALVESLDLVNPADVRVEEAMSAEPYSVSHETPLREVASIMAERKYGTAVVLDGQRLVGLLTTTDTLRALAAVLAPRA
jgi:acetoin utilization protein AcuB